MDEVKGSERTYTSPLRAQQAATTRQAVLDVARELFIAQGYGATTVDQIAVREKSKPHTSLAGNADWRTSTPSPNAHPQSSTVRLADAIHLYSLAGR